ncbi:MAG TPA: acetoacetate--CoA ligase [Desulfohalobiaceae bacterium]|nr:acetoacetate--CoA ligase [Desulfohalobiaceae bacterium]
MSKLQWQPSEDRLKSTNMYDFLNYIKDSYSLSLGNYNDLYSWSVDNIPEFWASWWQYSGLRYSSTYSEVIDDMSRLPGAKWFPGAKLNFSENLLRFRDEQIALVFKGEYNQTRRISYAQLYNEVSQLSESLKNLGIQPGDRVAAYMPNMPETIIAMLAASSLGATWSSCSPDFGYKGVLDRFGQIQPKVLFTSDGYFFKGKKFDRLGTVANILNDISAIEKVVVVPFTDKDPDISQMPKAIHYQDFKAATGDKDIDFVQLPFEHPHYIMYSSGTTGPPKCMVQGAGGILLQQMKELVLHTDLKRQDNIFYFTTCGWMMWNWMVSSLAVGSTIILYDGNPFYPDPSVLWEMAQDEEITVFGTSAGYLEALQNLGSKPGQEFDLSPLKALLSTGSPLTEELFRYVYTDIKQDLQLSSISGGTDINSCFALGNPMGAVYSGELQCRGLAMKVKAYDEQGNPVYNQPGELVCEAPVPSMPLYFWDDPEGSKYRAAYFDVYPGVWRHGDFIEINDRGGVKIYGRSDATLNPGGVRIGTAEIYRQVEALPEIEDSLVVGQQWHNDERVILFVKLVEGYTLDQELQQRIKRFIRENATPRHVPAKIISVPDIPYTLNMKKVELAVKKVINGQAVLNKGSLRNPESLDYFSNLQDLQED